MSNPATIQRALRFRLEPTPDQERAMERAAGARRWAWNWALEQRKTHYAETGKSLGTSALCKRLTALKQAPEHAWLREVDSQLPQQALRDLERAVVNFFEKRARFPRFKKKKTDTARFRIPQRVCLVDGWVVVPKVGRIRVRQSRPVLGKLGAATCKRNATGHWFVTMTETIRLEATPAVPPDPTRVVGLDRGLSSLSVGSDGSRVPAPRWYRQGERKLRRASRALSRAQRGSVGRQRARHRLALVHQKIRNLRADFLHKLTSGLVHRYDGFCIEDLNTRGLARTKLAKSVLDAAWGEFGRQLHYKADWLSKPVVKVGRWYPSSKTCSDCGWLLDELELSVRTWTCPACGVVHDRDENAALNLRVEGLRILAVGHTDNQNARGAAVRPATGRRAA